MHTWYAVNCKDALCTHHEHDIMQFGDNIITSCLQASKECIPTTKYKKRVAGWNEHVRAYRQNAMFWHWLWLEAGRPPTGEVASIRRKTRAEYHRAIKNTKRQENNIISQNMANAISNNNDRDLWKEVKRLRGTNRNFPKNVEGACSANNITDLFKDKFEKLYNRPNKTSHHKVRALLNKINDEIKPSNSSRNHVPCITVNLVKEAIDHIKTGKHDGDKGVMSDHFIFGSNKLFTLISMLFSAMLSHGSTCSSFVYSTIVPIPKNRRLSLSKTDNYRAIAMSNALTKVLDWIFIKLEGSVLHTDNRQFGFKQQSSTTMCTGLLMETVSFFTTRDSNVYTILLDASKAFDLVDYDNLFKLLYDRGMNKFMLRLLISLYTNQKLRVSWNSVNSEYFDVRNGVKQGGVLSPLLFSVYIDGLLTRLKASGLGCYVGNHYCGSLGYADDITLMSPTLNGLKEMLNICNLYAKEYSITFNPNKSQLIVFSNHQTADPQLVFNGVKIDKHDSVIHLGHLLKCKPRSPGGILSKIKSDFSLSVNMFIANFGYISTEVKSKLFNQFCMPLYGIVLGDITSQEAHDLHVAWKVACRRVMRLGPRTRSALIPGLMGCLPFESIVQKRLVRFLNSCINSSNELVSFVFKVSLFNNSNIGRSIRHLFYINNLCTETVSVNQLYKIKLFSGTSLVNTSVIRELVDIRDGVLVSGLEAADVTALLDFLCTA